MRSGKHNIPGALVEADKSWAMPRVAEVRKVELTNVNVSIDSADGKRTIGVRFTPPACDWP